ncbi:MAG: ThiF family adenylyltransferase [Saprospiraceae bacterium]|nr:ThiF family adenylyltransferase [Saprospiraceae bacterium]
MKSSTIFSAQQLERYARHLSLPGFGHGAQQKLLQSSVLVIGAGGLGAPVLQYLVAAGIGRLGLVEFDHIDLTNLQRQVLYTQDDIGRPKLTVAANRLQQMNSDVDIIRYPERLTSKNALSLFANYDLVVDGTDNFPTRYLANDAAVLTGTPYIYGSIFRYEGQVSVFNALMPDGGRSMNYRNLYPTPPHPDMVPNCMEGGVLGVLPGIIGSMQANEAIKVITGVGEPLLNKLFLFDAAASMARTITLPDATPVTVDQLIDYDQFCAPTHLPPLVKGITPSTLFSMLSSQAPLLLVDVREPFERVGGHLGGQLIPVGQIPDVLPQPVANDQPIIFYCQTGRRSAKAIRKLPATWAQQNPIFSLEGGIQAYINEYPEQELNHA